MMNVLDSVLSSTQSRTWLKRAGIAGFWFFLVKGLLWVAAGAAFYFTL